MIPDTINAIFEMGAAFAMCMDVRQILRDRATRGVYWPLRAYFLIWGFWNLYFYPAMGAPWSFTAGMILTIVNGIWVGFALQYRKN